MKAKIISFIFVAVILTLFLTIMLLVPDFIAGMFEDGINGVISNLHKWTHYDYFLDQIKFTFVVALIFAFIYLFFNGKKEN